MYIRFEIVVKFVLMNILYFSSPTLLMPFKKKVLRTRILMALFFRSLQCLFDRMNSYFALMQVDLPFRR